VPNVPPAGASKTTTEGSGPMVLGPEVPGGPPHLPVTPARMYQPSPMSNQWSTTNGQGSHQTNGSNVPSRPQEDSEMLDSSGDDPSQQFTGPQSQLSQRAAHTRLTQGSQLDQYHNSASTTSGQKTSDKSARSSGPYSVNTQLSNGAHHPDFSIMPEVAPGGSQIPDTQEPSSQSQPSSQHDPSSMPPPPQRQNSVSALLNPAVPAMPPPQRSIILDHGTVDDFHRQLLHNSSGLSVEQLEQVHAAMMEVVWRERGEWNRNHVLVKTQMAFNETIKDIENCQMVLGPSQPKT